MSVYHERASYYLEDGYITLRVLSINMPNAFSQNPTINKLAAVAKRLDIFDIGFCSKAYDCLKRKIWQLPQKPIPPKGVELAYAMRQEAPEKLRRNIR